MSFTYEHSNKPASQLVNSPTHNKTTRPFTVPDRIEEVQEKPNTTGMPDPVLQKMESAFHTDFSNVKIFPNSPKAPQLGARAYTQGSHIHFAPGEFSPSNSEGQKILKHELVHVVQQRQGIVKPTGRIKGLPLNDDPALESHAETAADK